MNDMQLVSKATLLTLKNRKNATIVDVANKLGMPISWVATRVNHLCESSEVAKSKIGHWPRKSGGFVYLQDKRRTKSKMRHGQHVFASATIATKSDHKNKMVEIVDTLGNYLGVIPSDNLVKID